MDDRVAPDLSFGADVRVRGIDKSHAALQHQLTNCRATYEVLKLGQLGARVNPINFPSIVVQVHTDLTAARQNNSRYVGQIVLALIVGGLDLAKGAEKISCFEAVDAAVDLFHL